MKTLKSIAYKTAVFSVVSLMLVVSQVSVSEASLIFIGDNTDVGQGFGAVVNILTMHEVYTGAGEDGDNEHGAVTWNGANDVYVDQALTDPNKTATHTFGSLGITDASQIFFEWDPAEVGSTAGKKTIVETLIMTIYTAGGAAVYTDSLASPVTHLDLFNPGVGGGDFNYGLNDAGILALNTFLGGVGDFSLYRIGLENLSNFVDDGPDTWILKAGTGNPIPEPATMLLFGTGLAGLAGIARRKRN